MTRSYLLLVALISAFSACKRQAPEVVDLTPTKEVVAGHEMIDYDDEKGAYTCRAPRLWGIDENNGSTFVGPRDPKTMGASYITILRYPESAGRWNDAQKYAESFWQIDPNHKQPEIEKRKVGDRTVLFLHQERPFRKIHSRKVEYMLRYDYALIPVAGGFFAIQHRAPLSAYMTTLPVFEAVVKSFQPKG
jgi:hypothetical protein